MCLYALEAFQATSRSHETALEQLAYLLDWWKYSFKIFQKLVGTQLQRWLKNTTRILKGAAEAAIQKSLVIHSLTDSLREAIPRKNLLMFGFFPNGLDHPTPVFLERFEKLFKNLILVKLKSLKVFGFWSSSPIYLGKCPSQSRKSSSSSLESGNPPPSSWKMSKLKQKSSSKVLE